MKMFGSLQNRINENSRMPAPKVGDAATITLWSDRHAATITRVNKSGRLIWVQHDKVRRTDRNGQSESQSYEYERDPNGRIDIFTLRKNGRWVQRGEGLHNGTGLLIGHREEYRDPCF